MSKRLIATILIILLPTGALADDSTPNPIQSNNSAASQLGPSTSTGQSDSSTSSSGILQPAGSDPLQSNNDSSSADQGSSAASTLQDPGTANQNLQVLAGNADGSPQVPSSTSLWGWVALVVGLLVVTGGATFLLFRSNQSISEEEAIFVTESMDDIPLEAEPEIEEITEEDQPEAETTDPTPAEDAHAEVETENETESAESDEISE